ncbi:SGNH/GDSL hydrolase family protein [Terriglobus albidus]|uniref:SGNH/GDSL hydrolase family protein n=1 Tax=Terriglobus albidus TaxID=1592106 RepID=UPI0021E0BBD1|nr:SGNH/GDSL hydrolase family protein [Terriglobus albidus]
MNFGDSITCGYTSSPADGTGYIYSNEGYAGQVSMEMEKTPHNLCRPGDLAADMARLWVYPNTNSVMGKNQVYTVMIGTNDANYCGDSNGCIDNWERSAGAAIAWLALPDKDKVLGSAITNTSGSWSRDSDLPIGSSTTDANAAVTFTIDAASAGKILYLAYRVFDPGLRDTTQATVSIDGTVAGQLNSAVDTGHLIATWWSTQESIFLAKYPLVSAGKHTVTLSTASTGGFFSFLWGGISSQNYNNLPGAPSVLLGSVPRAKADDLNYEILLYNKRFLEMANEFQQQGMNVTTVDTFHVYDTSDLSDDLHPNLAGHTKLAAAFQAAF